MKWKMLKLLMVVLIIVLSLNLVISQTTEGSIYVFGTEYTPNQNGKVWLHLVNSTGKEVLNGVCYVDIYSPNQTILVERALMNNFNHDGIYYYDLIIPDNSTLPNNYLGVYQVIAECFYEVGLVPNFALNYTLFNATYNANNIEFTTVLDNNRLNLQETLVALGNPRRLYVGFNFSRHTSICSNISEGLLTGISIEWVGIFNNIASDPLTIQIYNYSSLSWISLPNVVVGSGTGTKTVTNSLVFNNISKAGLVNSSGSNILLRFTDTNNTDTSSTGFDTDYLSVNCDRLSNPSWVEIKGSSELHVSEDLNQEDLARIIWEYTVRNLTYIPDMTNYTLINEIFQNTLLELGLIDELPTNVSYLGLYYLSYTYQSSLLNSSVTLESYPYVDLNRNYTIGLYIPTGTQLYPILNVDNATYNFTFLGSDNYEIVLSFDTVGDYFFQINESSNNLFSGTFLARDCYNITINLFKSKTGSRYKNNFAYLTAQLTDNYISTPHPMGERYLVPLGYDYMYNNNVFHTEFENGKGTLELCEKNVPMIIRLVDGEIIFASDYSRPNVTDSYGTNIYVGTFTFSGIDETLNIYLEDSEIYPYKWLFNWGFIIMVIFIIILTIVLFVYIPTIPQLAFGVGITGSLMLVLLRGVLFFTFGY